RLRRRPAAAPAAGGRGGGGEHAGLGDLRVAGADDLAGVGLGQCSGVAAATIRCAAIAHGVAPCEAGWFARVDNDLGWVSMKGWILSRTRRFIWLRHALPVQRNSTF